MNSLLIKIVVEIVFKALVFKFFNYIRVLCNYIAVLL